MGPTTPTELWPLPGLTQARRAIVVVDVVESVRLMEQNEAGFIDRWRRFVHDVRTEVLPKHGGRMVKSLGDGMLAEFEGVGSAVAAALRMIEMCGAGNMQLRVGIHAADIVIDGLDVYGSGVNLAARLGSLARPGEIVVSAAVRDAIADGVHAQVVDLGECFLKHVDGPVRAFSLQATSSDLQFRQPVEPVAEDMRATVAVLPYECLASDHSGKALGTALSDAVITRLCRLPGVRVISRLSTAALSRETDPIAACRHFLGAHFVVSGSYETDGVRSLGIAQVTDTRNGALLWADRFEIDVHDLFRDEDAGLIGMARYIGLAIAAATVQRARQMPVNNLESFTLYVAGVVLLHRLGRADFDRAHELLSALRERHPRAAAPAAMLGKWHVLQVLQGWADEPRQAGQRGLALAREALDREPDHPLALAMAGLLGVHFGHDLHAARGLALKAVEADPQEPNAWMTLAGIDSYLANGENSIANARRAIELSPLDPCRFMFDLLLAAGQLAAGRCDEAIASAEASIRLNAVHAPTYRLATIANVLGGRPDAARKAAGGLMALDPGFRVSSFAERYPGRDQPHASDYFRALREAGLPG